MLPRRHAENHVSIKSADDIKKIEEANQIIARIFEYIATVDLAGLSTSELDSIVEKEITKAKARPSFKTVPGYAHATCISVNNKVVHGIPNKKEIIKNGDIVKLDVGTVKNGFFGDACYTFKVGTIKPEADRLVECTREALRRGIAVALPGNRLGDIGAAIQNYVESEGYNIVRDYTGHGVGYAVHEPPTVLHYGKAGTGMRLQEGMVLAIEPMVNAGTWEIDMLRDGWTVVTADGSLSAQFEHSVAILKDGPLILSRYNEELLGGRKK